MKRNQQYKITKPSDDNTAAQHLDSTVCDNSDKQKHKLSQQKTTKLAFLGDSIPDQQQVSLLAEDHQQHHIDQVDKTQTSFSNQDDKRAISSASNMLGNANNGASNGSSGDHKSRRKATPPSSKSKKNQPILGDVEVEDIEANKSLDNDSSRSSRSFCRRYLTYIIMGLVAIVLVTTCVMLFKAQNTDRIDNCPHTFQPTKRSPTLFATKTPYTVALNYLSGSASTFSIPRGPNGSSSADDHGGVNSLMIDSQHLRSTHVPSIYSRLSLAQLDEKMKSQNCKAKYLYLVSRHGARLPSEEELKRINHHMKAILSKINPHVTESSTQAVSDTKQIPENMPQTCHNTLIAFRNWTNFATPEQGNQLTETGAKETVAMARRFKSIYPDLFDANLTDVSVAATDKLRTAQTAVNFIRQLDNYVPKGCQLSEYPSENTTDVGESIKIAKDKCLKNFGRDHAEPKLDFHHQCEKMAKKTVPNDLGLDLYNPTRTEFIVKSVRANLGLTEKGKSLSAEEVSVIYDVCKYETALRGVPSVWCSLFTKEHLDFYEYISDVGDYFNSTFGDEIFQRTACPITSDIYFNFKDIVEGKVVKQRANFYFSHSEVIQRIIAASVNLPADQQLDPSSVKASLAGQSKIPLDRDWRTSLLTPFSANMAFTLYECGQSADLSSLLPPNVFDAKQHDRFRVVASLNERPILLHGCTNYACAFEEAREFAKLFKERLCELESLCAKKISFT